MQSHSTTGSGALRWDDVRVLLALYRKGSLKQASTELAINISTVSRRLDAIEEVIGAHLFDRTPDGTHPTAATEALIPFAERMEQAAEGLVHGLEGFEIDPVGHVRITAPPGIVDHFLARGLVELADAYPRLRISILSSIGYADLQRREADIALRLMRPRSGDLVSTRVATTGWCILASPDYAASLGRLSNPDDARWITWGEDLSHMPDRRWVDAHVSPERVVLETSSMTAQLEAVRAGLGVTTAPPPYADLHGLTTVRCTPKIRKTLAALPEGSLWLVGHRALREVPRIAVVWDWLAERFRAV